MQRDLRLWHLNEAGYVVILDLCRKFIEPVVADSDPSRDTTELGHYCEYLGVVGGTAAWWGGGGEGEEQVRLQRRDEEKHSTFRRLCLCTAVFAPLWVGFSDTTFNIGTQHQLTAIFFPHLNPGDTWWLNYSSRCRKFIHVDKMVYKEKCEEKGESTLYACQGLL